MDGLIDPTKTGKYPIILGDSLLGKTSNDIFTGIRYNHKPCLTTPESSRARLKPSAPGQATSFDLSFPGKDNRPEHAYTGTRNTQDGQYVVYFDPEREAFVLDRIDSTFTMNITRTPGETDPEVLARKYPHLSADEKTSNPPPSAPDTKKEKAKANPIAKSPPRKKEPLIRKPTKKQQQQKIELALPKASPPKPMSKARPVDEEEEEEEEDDGGLLLEYPDGDPRGQKRDFNSPAFPAVRRFDEFMDQRESGGEDADGESDDELETDFKLPSPVKHHEPSNYEPEPMTEDNVYDPEHDEGDADLEDDLERDLEMAFEAEANSQNGTPPDGDESDISEED